MKRKKKHCSNQGFFVDLPIVNMEYNGRSIVLSTCLKILTQNAYLFGMIVISTSWIDHKSVIKGKMVLYLAFHF